MSLVADIIVAGSAVLLVVYSLWMVKQLFANN
jgi:hypothetical protein